jgi:outer membrane protein assembly factor BamB
MEFCSIFVHFCVFCGHFFPRTAGYAYIIFPMRQVLLDRIFISLLAAAGITAAAAADDWPQWRGPSRNGVWRETGIRRTLPEGQIELRWRVPIGSGYSGPTVAGSGVYVTDRLTDPKDVERVWCFDRKTGEVRWSHTYDCSYLRISYEAGPRCAVVIDDGRAYSLGAAGHLFCFDADSGEVIFEHDLREEYDIEMPIWGIAATPVIEGDLLIVPVSGADACFVAFDARSGAERWRALADGGNYSAPIVVDQAGRRVMICWTANRVVGLDPATGTLLWEHPFGPRSMPMGIATPVYERGNLFFSGFFDGCLMLRLDPDEMRVEKLWSRRGPNEKVTDGLHCCISTPMIRGDHIYGVDSYGQLRCLDTKDGTRIWEDLTAVPRARWATIHMVRHGERTWMLNEKGELIIAELKPEGFREIARTQLLRPTREQLPERGGVCWSHPAFAHRHVFARNDEELVCADLSLPAIKPQP